MVESGNYTESTSIDPATISNMSGLTDVTIEGVPGEATPVLNFAGGTVFQAGPADGNWTLSDLDIMSTGSFALAIQHGSISGLFVSGATDSGLIDLCATPDTTVIDTVCVDTGNDSSAWGYRAAGGGLSATLYNDTFYATQPDSYAMWLEQTADGTGDTVNATNVIALNGAAGDDVVAQTFGAPSDTATITMNYSDYEAPADINPGSQVVNGGGSIGAGPAFANAAAGDFHELANSFTIGAGLLNLANDGSVDLDGLPRSTSGKIDIGAYQYQPPATPTVTTSPASPTVAQSITFTAAESDPNPGAGALTYNWKFDDGATATGAVVTHAFATTGGHTATLTVGDGSPYNASATAQVTVDPPQPSVLNPAIALVKHRKSHKPTTYSESLTFSLNTAATVDLTLVRDLKGKRASGHCEASLARTAKLAPCPKTKTFASASFSGASGADTVPIPGSTISRRPPAGSYTVELTATNSTGSSTPVSATFRVP
jgi:hypothetical protein